MARGTLIAITTATAGIFIAGTAAAVAVVNAAQTTTASESISLVSSSAPESSAGVDFTPGDLPRINAPRSTTAQTASSLQAESKSSSKSTSRSAAPTTSPSAAAQQATGGLISSDTARAKVLKEVKGTVLSIADATRQGYNSFAVKVQAADGSVVVGFVDKATGVIFDWEVVSKATSPAGSGASGSKSSTSRDDDDDDHHSSDSTKSDSRDQESSHEHDGDDD